jgi:hypothetical protein
LAVVLTMLLPAWSAPGRAAPREVDPPATIPATARDQSDDCCPRWSASVDAICLWQGNIPGRPLLSSFDGVERGPTALDANQLLPGVSAGPRVDVIWRPAAEWSLQADYFNVTAFKLSRGVAGNPELAEEDLAGFSDTGFESASVGGSGTLQSAEINLRRRRPGASTAWLVGFRWVQFDQTLSIAEADIVPDPFQSTIESRVENDLYGGQIGFDTLIWNNPGRPLRVNAVGKAGIYAAAARQSMAYQDSDGFVLQLGDATTRTAFFGEVGMNASLRLTRWLRARAGYTVLWASGIAVPAGQFSANDFTTGIAGIDTSGSVLLHGFTAGVEVAW